MGKHPPLVNHLTKPIGFVGFRWAIWRSGRNPQKNNRTRKRMDAPPPPGAASVGSIAPGVGEGHGIPP